MAWLAHRLMRAGWRVVGGGTSSAGSERGLLMPKQLFSQCCKHEVVSDSRQMQVTIYEQPLIPTTVSILLSKKSREQIDESFAICPTKLSPDRHLATVPIVTGEL